jgi:catechol 2,3-dioxygenase-like lactoylglutathione lyase family enzyme
LLVRDYDEAIAFFVDKLGFTVQEDSPSVTKEGHPKRWVVVQPSPEASGAASCGASLLLAQADGPAQADLVGQQFGGRVGFFWRVDDFQRTYDRLHRAGVELIEEPRSEPYGTVVVFKDLYGNLWDLLGP